MGDVAMNLHTPSSAPVAPHQPAPAARRIAAGIAVAILATPLAGCDKCLNFIWERPAACREYAPPRPSGPPAGVLPQFAPDVSLR
jgi:hypothetical protein